MAARETTEEYRARVRAIVDACPPLTAEQRWRLAVLLNPPRRTEQKPTR